MDWQHNLAINLLKTARPRQWLKSMAVFAALVFSGWLFIPEKFTLAFYAFIIMSMLSSGLYFINDLVDKVQDQAHPFKRLRPIAAGTLDPQLALTVALLLIGTSIFWSFSFKPAFSAAVLAFAFIQISYSLFLKQIILLDVMTIAASFIIRVYAGTFIIGAPSINVWFLLAVISTALFLAIGKRRSELTILKGQPAGLHRATLSHYPETLLDIFTAMFATTTWLTYALFAFNFPTLHLKPEYAALLYPYLPAAIEHAEKLLMISVPFVIYGVMRYLYLIYEKKEGESPERILLSDAPLLATVVLWALVILVVLYGLNPH